MKYLAKINHRMPCISKADHIIWLLLHVIVVFLVILRTTYASEAQDRDDAACSLQRLTSVTKKKNYEDIRNFIQSCCRHDRDRSREDLCEQAIAVESLVTDSFLLPEIECVRVYQRRYTHRNCRVLRVGFDNNSKILTSFYKKALNDFVDNHLDDAELNLYIVGHSNHTGPEDYNLTLSRERAEVVADYLISTGLRDADIDTDGMGWASPLGGLSEKDGLQRRVEISIESASGNR